MKKYLIDEFNYICFPLSFNEKLEIISPVLKIKSIIETGYKELKEQKEDVEWNTDTHEIFDKEYYKEQVNEIKNFTSLIKEKYLYM